MKKITLECDIMIRQDHIGEIHERLVPVMFDYDQDDAKTRVTPYFEIKTLDICAGHFAEMTEKRRLIYGYGAMGHNDYSLLSY